MGKKYLCSLKADLDDYKYDNAVKYAFNKKQAKESRDIFLEKDFKNNKKILKIPKRYVGIVVGKHHNVK